MSCQSCQLSFLNFPYSYMPNNFSLKYVNGFYWHLELCPWCLVQFAPLFCCVFEFCILSSFRNQNQLAFDSHNRVSARGCETSNLIAFITYKHFVVILKNLLYRTFMQHTVLCTFHFSFNFSSIHFSDRFVNLFLYAFLCVSSLYTY